MSLVVHPLTAERRPDFERFHAREDCGGWCHCVAWWVPTWEGWGERTEAENRAVREGLFARGEHDGYLGYLEGEPVAWCQVGPRDRLEKLRVQFDLEPDPAVWAISCLQVVPEHRGRGVARELVAGVIADLATRGGARVEAYPRVVAAEGEALEPGEQWTGPLSLYRGLGFEHVRNAGKRAVYSIGLPAGP